MHYCYSSTLFVYNNKRGKSMKLCETCKNNNCSKKIVISEENGIKTIKCLEYEKDRDKIKGYEKTLDRTATICGTVMPKLITDWSK